MTSKKSTPSLPANSCSYERYDPETLQPLNEETWTRLAELGWTARDFAGRAILDIGANTGMLSIEACRLGAREVKAYDVQAPLVEFLGNLAKTKNLPIETAKKGLNELHAPDDAADVVLFMEVLHWVVSQGMQLDTVIKKLASLTRQTLYIEFPWSVAEPSIKAQTNLNVSTYAPDLIIDLLTQHFADVRIVRFMRYMGIQSGSQRVLIKASAPRWTSHVLATIPDMRALDISVDGNRHRNALAHGPHGLFFVKEVSKESAFNTLPSKVVDRIFEGLEATDAKCLVLPIRLPTGYVHKENGIAAMIFPYISESWSGVRSARTDISLDELIQFLIALRREFAAIEADVVPLFATNISRTIDLPHARNTKWQSMFKGSTLNGSDFHKMVGDFENQQMTCLQHGDLQTSNLLKVKGRLVAVDLDNLSIGTPYSDGLCSLIWYGAPPMAFETFVNQLQLQGESAPTPLDLALTARRSFGWYSAASELISPESKVIAQFLSGFRAFLEFANHFPFTEDPREGSCMA